MAPSRTASNGRSRFEPLVRHHPPLAQVVFAAPVEGLKGKGESLCRGVKRLDRGGNHFLANPVTGKKRDLIVFHSGFDSTLESSVSKQQDEKGEGIKSFGHAICGTSPPRPSIIPPMRKVYRRLFSIFACCLLASISSKGGQAATNVDSPYVPQAVILSLSGNPYPGVARALSTVGFRVRKASDYRSTPPAPPSLLIIPEVEGQQLDPQLVQTILRDVEAGMPLLLDGSTPLAKELGIKPLGARGDITQYRWDRYADDPVRLPGRIVYPRFKATPALEVLARDPGRNSPLLVSGSRGLGRFIYSAIPLEPQVGLVFQYLPFLAQAILDELHVAPTLAADNLCVYVDLGGEPRSIRTWWWSD